MRSCITKNSFPKGTSPTVPLKIMDPPEHLKKEWSNILQECAKQLTQQFLFDNYVSYR